jgi:RNA-binding protein
MEDLTAKQRAHLRGLAHPLKPLLHVGKEGATEDTISALAQALSTRELLKVRVLETAPASVRDTAEGLVAGVPGAVLVQTIGRTAVVYRAHPDRPEIRLPHPRRRMYAPQRRTMSRAVEP